MSHQGCDDTRCDARDSFGSAPVVAIGNIMGSNIYNILGIGGVTGLIHPTVVPPEIATFDNLVMIGASVPMFAFAWSGQRVGRLEGAGLLAGYIAYVVSLLSR